MFYLKKKTNIISLMILLGYHWTWVENVILFEADNNGDENVMLHKQNITEVKYNLK